MDDGLPETLVDVWAGLMTQVRGQRDMTVQGSAWQHMAVQAVQATHGSASSTGNIWQHRQYRAACGST